MRRESSLFAWDWPRVNAEMFVSLEPLAPGQAGVASHPREEAQPGRAPSV